MGKNNKSDKNKEQNIAAKNTPPTQTKKKESRDITIWEEKQELIDTTHHARLTRNTTNRQLHSAPTAPPTAFQEKGTIREEAGARKLGQIKNEIKKMEPKLTTRKRNLSQDELYTAHSYWKASKQSDTTQKEDKQNTGGDSEQKAHDTTGVIQDQDNDQEVIAQGMEVQDKKFNSTGITTSGQYITNNDTTVYQNVKWESRKDPIPYVASSIQTPGNITRVPRNSKITPRLEVNNSGKSYNSKTSSFLEMAEEQSETMVENEDREDDNADSDANDDGNDTVTIDDDQETDSDDQDDMKGANT